jgi:hypothetical protein
MMSNDLLDRIKKRTATDLIDAYIESHEKGYLTDQFRQSLKSLLGFKYERLRGTYGQEMKHYIYYKICEDWKDPRNSGRWGKSHYLSARIEIFAYKYRSYRMTDDKIKRLLDRRTRTQKEVELALAF